MLYPSPLQFVSKVVEETAGGDNTVRLRFYDALFGLQNADWRGDIQPGSDVRYSKTPAELIPIAGYGVDGAHAGLVIHAPELPQDDFPVGAYCEIDLDGVLFAGRDTRHFIEMRLSASIACWDTAGQDVEEIRRGGYGGDDPEGFAAKMRADAQAKRNKYAPYVDALAKELGIKPDPKMKIFGWGAERKEMPIPDIPDGWHYLRTPDFIGVLARKELFDPSYREDVDSNDQLRSARMLRRRGFPATALYVLKRAGWEASPDSNRYIQILKEMAQTYEVLRRPMLACATEETMTHVRRCM